MTQVTRALRAAEFRFLTGMDSAILIRNDDNGAHNNPARRMIAGDHRDADIMRALAMHAAHGSRSVHADLCANGVSR
jgi:hypothetical protein